jgi:hypothetical protein
MRARDVYLEIEDAAWQGAPLGAVAAGLGLTLAEMLRRTCGLGVYTRGLPASAR